MNYYKEAILTVDFETAISETKKVLKEEGFGVISEIEINKKIKEKLGTDFRKYTILGACSPSMAYQALLEEDKIGTMLPCNVIVQELAENKIEVAAVDPTASMQAVDNENLKAIAYTIKEGLEKAMSKLNNAPLEI